MKPSRTDNRLQFSASAEASLIRRRGEGASTRVLIGLTFWGMVAISGLFLFLAILIAPLRQEVEFSSYAWSIAVTLAPIGVGCTFALQWFRAGWNEQVVTISSDQISVHYEGMLASPANSYQLSKIRKIGVNRGALHIIFFYKVHRALLNGGTEDELKRAEGLVLSRMDEGGWKCQHFTDDILF